MLMQPWNPEPIKHRSPLHDPDPSMAFVSTEPGNEEKPVTTIPDSGVDTAPLLQG
jgi:hypothetical protein